MKTFIVSLILASLAFGFVVWNSVCISAKLDNLLELAEALPADADAFDENDPATKEHMEALWQLWDKNFNRIAFTSGYENIDRADDAAVTMYVSFQNGSADDFTIARQAFCDGIERLKTLESFTLNGIL